jgi:hypothetical protein
MFAVVGQRHANPIAPDKVQRVAAGYAVSRAKREPGTRFNVYWDGEAAFVRAASEERPARALLICAALCPAWDADAHVRYVQTGEN